VAGINRQEGNIASMNGHSAYNFVLLRRLYLFGLKQKGIKEIFKALLFPYQGKLDEIIALLLLSE